MLTITWMTQRWTAPPAQQQEHEPRLGLLLLLLLDGGAMCPCMSPPRLSGHPCRRGGKLPPAR